MLGVQTCFYLMIRKDYAHQYETEKQCDVRVMPDGERGEVSQEVIQVEIVTKIYKSLASLIAENFFWKKMAERPSVFRENSFLKWIGNILVHELNCAIVSFCYRNGIDVPKLLPPIKRIKIEEGTNTEAKTDDHQLQAAKKVALVSHRCGGCQSADESLGKCSLGRRSLYATQRGYQR
jgi:hypothetical protein